MNLAHERDEGTEAGPRVLRVVQGKVHGLNTWALLDTGAVPDILSLSFSQRLSLRFTSTTKCITVANGQICATVGIVQDVPISFLDKTLRLKFLVVKDSPFDVIVGIPTIERRLRAILDYDKLQVRMTIDGAKVELPLEQDIGRRNVAS